MAQSLKTVKEVGALNLANALNLGTPETIVGAGSGKQAISLDTVVTLLDNDATADLTLAAGQPGQLKVLVCVDATAAATLDSSDAGALNPTTTLTFDTVGDSAVLCYANSAWNVVSNNIV